MTMMDIKFEQAPGIEEDLCKTCRNVGMNPEACDSRSYQMEQYSDPFYVPEKYSE
jgi:hypothetical protein